MAPGFPESQRSPRCPEHRQKHQARRCGRTEDARAQPPCQRHAENANPHDAARNRERNCSARKIRRLAAFVAPMAFMMPISPRRSSTVAADVAATASAAAISAASVTIQSSVLTREKNAALSIGHAPDRAHIRAGQDLLDLETDRGNVWRAEPAVVFGRASAYSGSRSDKCIRRLRQRTHKKLPKLARMARKILCGGQVVTSTAFIFRTAGGNDSGDRSGRFRAASGLVRSWHNLVSPAQFRRDKLVGKRCTHDAFVRAIVKPAPLDASTRDA